MSEPTHNASLPSVQADKQARKNAARELLMDFANWYDQFSDEVVILPEEIDRYLEEVDRG